MFGTRENFPYFECSRCGCLQISQVPENMSKYYLQDYYLSSQPKPKRTIRGFLRRAMLRMPFLFHGKILGRYTSALFRYSVLYYCSSKTYFNLNSRVLEVGCGKGSLLRVLHDLGYRNLVGVDPYSYEGMVNNGIKILKRTIHDLPDTQMFDIIIFDHSFEHIFDQLETLKKTSKIMSDNSVCLIRMPVKTEYIWKRYSTSWVQIDAPRHFFLHTLKSIRLLAEEAGLSIEKTVFDSTEFQFWGSEQYRKGIPLRADNSYMVDPEMSIFTAKQIRQFKRMAKILNKNNQGDQAQFYIVKEK